MPEDLETEVDIRRAEYLLKKIELEQRSHNDAKAWQRVIAAPLVIAVVVAVLGGIASLYVENTKISSSGENEKFSREHAILLSTDQLDPDQRKEKLCQFSFSNSFQHLDSRAILDRFVANNPDCRAPGIIIMDASTSETDDNTEIQQEINTLEQCLSSQAVQTASCRAYDKSGFHNSPRASCSISLYAGEGRFFAESSVEVVDEFYRRLSGPPASEAIVAVDDNKPVRAFAGRISCTNSAGTGRTCEARATVQLPSYPDGCLPHLADLATQ